MRIALLYNDDCNFVDELLNYDLTFLVYEEKYIDFLLKYNKPIKIVKHDKERYDVLISTNENVENIKADKKIIIGKTGEAKKKIFYLQKFDIQEILKQQEKHDYKFSIIIPNYNNGDWINKTIESVLNQTYANWEMYIIDDISTDNSIEVVEQYKDERINLIKNEIKLYNGGSRNIGILKAKKSNPDGYLLFIDSDDWLANNQVLERLNNFIENEDLITLDYQLYMNYELKGIGKCNYKNKDNLFMTCGAMCAVWCKCFKTEVAPLFEFNTLMEDRNYHYRLINRINTYANFDDVTHIWNKMNTKSITSDKYQKYNGDLQAKLQWDNCAFRHIAGMLDLLNELSNPKWISFIKNKIETCKQKVNNGVYEQF